MRAESRSTVSSSPTGTASCRTIGPLSSVASTKCTMAPPSVPARWASIRAWRLDPRPLTRTPTVFIGVLAPRPSSFEGGVETLRCGKRETSGVCAPRRTMPSFERDARPLHHGADHEARLTPPLERMLDVVKVPGADDHDHADAHVEGTVHLVLRDRPALLSYA